MYQKPHFLLFVIVGLLMLIVLPARSVQASDFESIRLAPTSIHSLSGTTQGSVDSLGIQEQAGAEDDPSKYVILQTPEARYEGYLTFSLPVAQRPESVSGLKVILNYKGPTPTSQTWTWSLYDWENETWIQVGSNRGTRANYWSTQQFVAARVMPFIRPDGEIRLRAQSNNANGDAKIDYAVVEVTYLKTPAPFPPDQGPPFPRLGMWWPDPWKQPLYQIARYDWVILFDDQAEFIEPLKAINPNLLLLTSTNACEVDFDPEDPAHNIEVAALPAEWFLTQVGTRLRTAIDAVQTTIPVEAVTVSDGQTTYRLFVPGDTVLIEGESMYVTAVNATARTLTVRRGYIRPASPHAAGTRIAAHISFWPNSWVMNLSPLSPRVTFDPAVGPENWAEYHARMTAQQLIEEPRWDGILLDRSDGNESWLLDNSTARTIDPDQSNTLLNDYSGFDAAWNDGLFDYESRLRTLVGPDEIIFTNWGYPNYGLLNGNNFEGFPNKLGQSYQAGWNETVFGNSPNYGSYFSWIKNALQPNLTMIETYQDDSSPSATSSGVYRNPCARRRFIPDYRKMRFGLGTALLNDGYFSYEMNTNGHGSLCLMWFDEYDNAGAGRGYLGYPLGPAVRLSDTLTTPNLVNGGIFETEADLSRWDIWADSGYDIQAALDSENPGEGSASLRLDVPIASGTDWKAVVIYSPVSLTARRDYTLTFRARSNAPRPMTVWAQRNRSPWNTWLDFGEVTLTPEWQTFQIAVPSTGSDSVASLQFGLGQTTGNVWLDDVRLQQGSLDIWRREFEGGLALVNATSLPVTIPLDGTYYRIKGLQAPAFNNGAAVTSVTLNARDAIILLKP